MEVTGTAQGLQSDQFDTGSKGMSPPRRSRHVPQVITMAADNSICFTEISQLLDCLIYTA